MTGAYSGILRNMMQACCLLVAAMVLPGTVSAQDTKPGAAPKPDPYAHRYPFEYKTSAGAPKMPARYRVESYQTSFCTKELKKEAVDFLTKQKIAVLNRANDARDYLQKMRTYIESERQAKEKDSVIRADELALHAFEEQLLHVMTFADPEEAKDRLDEAEARPVKNCEDTKAAERRLFPESVSSGTGVSPASAGGDVPIVTGDLQPAAGSAPPKRTPTHSGLRQPAQTIKKPLPSSSYKGYQPPVIPKPKTGGAIPQPPGALKQDIRYIKVPGGN